MMLDEVLHLTWVYGGGGQVGLIETFEMYCEK